MGDEAGDLGLTQSAEVAGAIKRMEPRGRELIGIADVVEDRREHQDPAVVPHRRSDGFGEACDSTDVVPARSQVAYVDLSEPDRPRGHARRCGHHHSTLLIAHCDVTRDWGWLFLTRGRPRGSCV